MTGMRSVSVAAVCVVAALSAACVRSSDGTPVAGPAAGTAAGTSTATTSAAPPGSSDPAAPGGHPDFGVLPTTTSVVPANTVTCGPSKKPPVGMVAQVADAQAPVITVAVPTGWSMQGGTGDVGGKLTGPDGMSATIGIAPTTLEPVQAFEDYADKLMGESAVSSISVLPGELCDYSGQKLMGAWSDTPQNAMEFVDRVVHVWTDSRNYLVSVHTEAPTGTPGFDAAAETLTSDFEVRIP